MALKSVYSNFTGQTFKVDNANREVSAPYVMINGIARPVQSDYIRINGVDKQISCYAYCTCDQVNSCNCEDDDSCICEDNDGCCEGDDGYNGYLCPEEHICNSHGPDSCNESYTCCEGGGTDVCVSEY